jgi:hypothetical protein
MVHARVFDDEREIKRHLRAQPVGACCLCPSTVLSDGTVVGKVLRNSGSGIVGEPIKAECDDMMSKESSDGQKLVANTRTAIGFLALGVYHPNPR